MPMNTRLKRSAGQLRNSPIAITWPTISSTRRLRVRPISPVAQNEHLRAHPTWAERQSV